MKNDSSPATKGGKKKGGRGRGNVCKESPLSCLAEEKENRWAFEVRRICFPRSRGREWKVPVHKNENYKVGLYGAVKSYFAAYLT